MRVSETYVVEFDNFGKTGEPEDIDECMLTVCQCFGNSIKYVNCFKGKEAVEMYHKMKGDLHD